MRSLNKRTKWLVLALIVAVGLVTATQVMQRVGKVDVDALVEEATTAFARQDVTTAGTLLDRALAAEPDNAPALLARGKLWSSIGDYKSAIADWRNVQVVDGVSRTRGMASEARLLEAELQVAMHQALAAERALLESWELRQSKENLPALELLLRVYVLQMRREAIRSVLDLIETHRPLALEEMILRVDAGAPIVAEDEALLQLREFVDGDPSDVFSCVALSRYLMSSEKFADAESLLSSKTVRITEHSSLVGLNALCKFKLGKSDEALATMATPLPDGGLDYWWWLAAGELTEQAQQLALAVDCFAMASSAQPDSGYARYRYGLALQANGATSESKSQLETAATIDRLHQQTVAVTRLVNLSPADFVKGVLQVAVSLHELKSARECAAWARLALQIDPSNQVAKELSSVSSANDERVSQVGSEKSTAAYNSARKWFASYEKKIVSESAIVSTSDSKPKFEDVHKEVQLDFQYFNGNSGFKYLIEAMGGGVSVLDFDNDGWPDCYFPQGCKFPLDASDFTYLDQLYRNVGGERFANVTSLARVIENGYSQGTATGDINNDGFADVIVANYGRNRVFINQGDGTFVDASDPWQLNESEMSSSLALADLDRDGNLDLYVVNYVDSLRICRDSQGNVSTCNPQNFSGVQDRLYQNSGDGRFVDVTSTAGVVTGDGKGLGVVTADLDDDGWVDIYVANDTNPNFLFKNLGGMRFEEIGLASGTALSDEGKAQAGMGIAAGDFDGDLRSDLFVTNFYLEANNLFLNHGSMNFKDEAMKAKLSLASKRVLGFGTQGEDIDLDGDLDLVVANGHIDDFSARGDPWKMPTQVFRNLGDGTFEDCAKTAGAYFQGSYLGRGVASLDWNRDGRRDFVVVHQDRPIALLENRTETEMRGLAVQLIGCESNRDAIGARVFHAFSGREQVRELRGGDGFYATNERVLTLSRVGLGAELRIVWPSGKVTSIHSNEALMEVVVTEN